MENEEFMDDLMRKLRDEVDGITDPFKIVESKVEKYPINSLDGARVDVTTQNIQNALNAETAATQSSQESNITPHSFCHMGFDLALLGRPTPWVVTLHVKEGTLTSINRQRVYGVGDSETLMENEEFMDDLMRKLRDEVDGITDPFKIVESKVEKYPINSLDSVRVDVTAQNIQNALNAETAATQSSQESNITPHVLVPDISPRPRSQRILNKKLAKNPTGNGSSNSNSIDLE
nr:hypothetical protein [Tanacetum cinerariifolium]